MPRKPNDLTINNPYDHLTALHPIDQRRSGKIVWRVRCECGREKNVIAGNLVNKSVRSCGQCGVLKDNKKEMHGRTKDLTGMQLDNAVVLKYIGPASRGIDWLCKCSLCGEEFTENSTRILGAHNEIHRHHGHKCAEVEKPSGKTIIPALPGTPMPRLLTDPAAKSRKGKAYRKNWTLNETAAMEVLAYQRSVGVHVSIGWC